MFQFIEYYDVEFCRKNSKSIIVFGDNLKGHGKNGQAIIRDEHNSFGVPTKREPTMAKDAYFSDKKEEYEIVKEKLISLWNLHKEGKTIVLPVNQIGTGLSKIEEKSPLIHKFISRFYESAKKEIIEHTKHIYTTPTLDFEGKNSKEDNDEHVLTVDECLKHIEDMKSSSKQKYSHL